MIKIFRFFRGKRKSSEYINPTSLFIDKYMRTFIITNYIEPFEFAKDMLIQAEIDYPMTIESLFEGLQELIEVYNHKTSLGRHIRLLGIFTSMGANATVAGKKLKAGLLAHKKG